MANEENNFTTTVKLRVPFNGYVDFEVGVMNTDHAVEDAKQMLLINCRVDINTKGQLTVSHPDDNDIDIRVLDMDLNNKLDVKKAKILE